MIPRRVLVIAEGQLGDLVLLTPALRSCKESFPDSAVTVLVVQRRSPAPTSPGPPFVRPALATGIPALVLSTPAVEKVFEVDRSQLRALHGLDRLRAEWDVVQWLRGGHFDTVVCTFPEDRFALWAWASGARRRVGQRRQAFRWLLTETPPIERDDRGVLRYYLALSRALGARVTSETTEIVVPEPALRWAREFIRVECAGEGRLVTVHPGASGDYKIWPPESFAAAMETLADGGFRMVLCGGEADSEMIREVRNAGSRTFPAAETGSDPARLAALLSVSDLCITNDSGPRHLAIATGAPTLAIFRRHHDRAWGVYEESDRCATVKSEEECPVCPRGSCRDKRREGYRFGSVCVRMVSVDAVVRRALAMLSASSPGTRRTSSDDTGRSA